MHYGEDQKNYLKYDWDAFVTWLRELKASDKLICSLRYTALITLCHGLKTRQSVKEVMSAYRARARTIWTNEERDVANFFF